MGYYTDSRTNIQKFEPDNTDTTLYIVGSIFPSMQDILDTVRHNWGDDAANLDRLTITAEHIHTDCIGYDQYDSGDYTDYLVVTRILD